MCDTASCPFSPHFASLLQQLVAADSDAGIGAGGGSAVAGTVTAGERRCDVCLRHSIAAAVPRSEAALPLVEIEVEAAAPVTAAMDGGAGDQCEEWSVPLSDSFAACRPSAAVGLDTAAAASLARGALPSAVCDVFLCVSAERSRLLSVLYRLCATVAATLSSERAQRSAVPAYLALTCQHVQQPVVILTAQPLHSHSAQQHQADVSRWSQLRAIQHDSEPAWNGVQVQSASQTTSQPDNTPAMPHTTQHSRIRIACE